MKESISELDHMQLLLMGKDVELAAAQLEIQKGKLELFKRGLVIIYKMDSGDSINVKGEIFRGVKTEEAETLEQSNKLA